MKKTYMYHLNTFAKKISKKNQARKLKFGVHLRNTKKKTHNNCPQDRTFLAELQSPDCFRDLWAAIHGLAHLLLCML